MIKILYKTLTKNVIFYVINALMILVIILNMANFFENFWFSIYLIIHIILSAYFLIFIVYLIKDHLFRFSLQQIFMAICFSTFIFILPKFFDTNHMFKSILTITTYSIYIVTGILIMIKE
jgi:hypothetical protein